MSFRKLKRFSGYRNPDNVFIFVRYAFIRLQAKQATDGRRQTEEQVITDIRIKPSFAHSVLSRKNPKFAEIKVFSGLYLLFVGNYLFLPLSTFYLPPIWQTRQVFVTDRRIK